MNNRWNIFPSCINSHLLYIIKQHVGLYYLFSFPLETYPHPNCGSDVKKKLIVELEIVPSFSPIRAIKENKSSNNICLIISLLINLKNLKSILIRSLILPDSLIYSKRLSTILKICINILPNNKWPANFQCFLSLYFPNSIDSTPFNSDTTFIPPMYCTCPISPFKLMFWILT